MKPMTPNDRGARVVPLDAPPHNEVQLLLPWLVSGRLEGADLALVRAHVADCPRCQADLDWQRILHARYAELGSEADVERGLAAARRQLQQAGDRRPRQAMALLRGWCTAWRGAWQAAAPRLRTLMALQGAAIGALALAVALLLPSLTPSRDDAFHVLGTSHGAASANAVVRFRADATERAIRGALQESGARVVDGPTASGAYLISVAPGNRHAAVERLRADAAVLLAESLE